MIMSGVMLAIEANDRQAGIDGLFGTPGMTIPVQRQIACSDTHSGRLAIGVGLENRGNDSFGKLLRLSNNVVELPLAESWPIPQFDDRSMMAVAAANEHIRDARRCDDLADSIHRRRGRPASQVHAHDGELGPPSLDHECLGPQGVDDALGQKVVPCAIPHLGTGLAGVISRFATPTFRPEDETLDESSAIDHSQSARALGSQPAQSPAIFTPTANASVRTARVCLMIASLG
jgi:hypothetical protein